MATTGVPNIKTYIEKSYNVLLVGKHGTSKTFSVMQACKELNLKLKYYSASTLDPYTDLVGVPVPVTNEETGMKELTMVRPREIDEAEVIMFDELNRSEPKVRNAVLELIQFQSINGEKLPNLKCIIAAVNPPDDKNTYDVEDLDPALVDRFHLVIEVEPKISRPYFCGIFGREIGLALANWWEDQNRLKRDAYVSPRRLETIGHVWTHTPTRAAIEAAMPPGVQLEVTNLMDALREASRTPEERAEAARRAAERLQAENQNRTPAGISVSGWSGPVIRDIRKQPEVIQALKENPNDINLHERVAGALGANGTRASDVILRHANTLEHLSGPSTAGMVNKWNATKKSEARTRLRKTIQQSVEDEAVIRAKYSKIASALESPNSRNIMDKSLASRPTPVRTNKITIPGQPGINNYVFTTSTQTQPPSQPQPGQVSIYDPTGAVTWETIVSGEPFQPTQQ